MDAVKHRSLLKRREEWLVTRARGTIEAAFKKIPAELRREREISSIRRWQRAAQLDRSASRGSSRPSSACSSRSSGSYVSARSYASSLPGAANTSLHSSPLPMHAAPNPTGARAALERLIAERPSDRSAAINGDVLAPRYPESPSTSPGGAGYPNRPAASSSMDSASGSPAPSPAASPCIRRGVPANFF